MSEDIINVKLTVDKMAVKSETLNLLVLIYSQQSGYSNEVRLFSAVRSSESELW